MHLSPVPWALNEGGRDAGAKGGGGGREGGGGGGGGGDRGSATVFHQNFGSLWSSKLCLLSFCAVIFEQRGLLLITAHLFPRSAPWQCSVFLTQSHSIKFVLFPHFVEQRLAANRRAQLCTQQKRSRHFSMERIRFLRGWGQAMT